MHRTMIAALLIAATGARLSRCEEPVNFPDAKLKAAVEQALGVTNPMPTDMLALTKLDAPALDIADLTGLEYARHLEHLWIAHNQIANIGPLSGLAKLTFLDLCDNRIGNVNVLSRLTDLQYLYVARNDFTDISAVAGLTKLQGLDLGLNAISDLSPLSGLTRLTQLTLVDCQIRDITPLAGLVNLDELVLYGNLVSDITPLSGLTNLGQLYLSRNLVSDISPLSGLTRLWAVVLGYNPLNRKAYCVDLQTVLNVNPDLSTDFLSFQANANPPGGVSASDGTYTDKVVVSWESLCPGPERSDSFQYMVYRSTSQDGEKEAVSGWVNGTSFDDTTASPGVHYHYWVKSNYSTDFSDPDEGFAAGGGEPDLSIASIDFLNDESPFLPNVLKVRVAVENVGNGVAQNVVVKLTINNAVVGEKAIDSIGPQKRKEADITWTASSNVENATVEARAVLSGQEESNPSNDVKSQVFSFYWADFRHDRDAFAFPNWGWSFSNFGEFADEFSEFLKSQLTEERYAVFVTSLATPWLYGALSKSGHCYGMSMASVVWRESPDLKPVPKETYAMSFQEARPGILFYHWQVPLYVLSKGIWELPPTSYSVQAVYDELLHSIRDENKPVVLALSSWPPAAGHAVVGYAIVDLQDHKRVFIYDNEMPLTYLQDHKAAVQCATLTISQNQAEYLGFNRISVAPTSILREDMTAIISRLVRQKTGEWWNKGLMLFRTRSPVNSLLTDENGRRIGYVDGSFVNEIPLAEMESQSGSYLFHLPSDLIYSVEMIGTGAGVVGLDFIVPLNESQTQVVIYEGLTVTIGSQISTRLSRANVAPNVTFSTGETVAPSGTATATVFENGDLTVDILTPTPADDYVSTSVSRPSYDRRTGLFSVNVTIKNKSSRVIGVPIWFVIESVSSFWVTPVNTSGTTVDGKPYIDLSGLLADGKLDPSETISQRVYFSNPGRVSFTFKSSVRGVISP